MSRVKLLLDAVEDMRSLADSLQAVADSIIEDEVPEEKEPAASSAPSAQPEEPTLSLEEVRAFLGQKSREGYTDAVRGLLQQFGAAKLSEVKEKDYAALMKVAEELDHGA